MNPWELFWAALGWGAFVVITLVFFMVAVVLIMGIVGVIRRKSQPVTRERRHIKRREINFDHDQLHGK